MIGHFAPNHLRTSIQPSTHLLKACQKGTFSPPGRSVGASASEVCSASYTPCAWPFSTAPALAFLPQQGHRRAVSPTFGDAHTRATHKHVTHRVPRAAVVGSAAHYRGRANAHRALSHSACTQDMTTEGQHQRGTVPHSIYTRHDYRGPTQRGTVPHSIYTRHDAQVRTLGRVK
jgi:hypothetical protein